MKEAIPVTRPYKLVSREIKADGTKIQIGKVSVGNDSMVIIAGPCAIEDEKQAMTIAEHVKNSGGDMFRGGAFKPRTSPYSFQGLGEQGLKILARVRETVWDSPEVAELIKSAKEEGDLKENSAYDEAKQEQGFLEGRIQLLARSLKWPESRFRNSGENESSVSPGSS